MTTEPVEQPPGAVSAWLRRLFGAVYDALVSALDTIFARIQSLVGTRRIPYLFVLPNLLIFGIFILVPMLLNFVYAFTGGDSFLPQERTFVGAENFAQLLECEDFLNPNTCREDLFWRAVFNTTGYVAGQVSLMVAASLLTALILNRKLHLRTFFRSVYFYPVLLSPIVVALIWKWILQENGVLNGLLVALGMAKMPFLVDASWARFWVVIISVWSTMGFYTLILLAGLQSIPAELYEAANIDGANSWQSFRRITLPLLMPTLLVVMVLSLIRAVQVFDVVFAFTGGGPGTATLYLVQYIYDNGFSSPNKQYGLAAGASLLMAGTLVVLTLIQLRLNREEHTA